MHNAASCAVCKMHIDVDKDELCRLNILHYIRVCSTWMCGYALICYTVTMLYYLGAAFTRFQTLRLQKVFPSVLADQLISYGSCQFPTLGFVVERYKHCLLYTSPSPRDS